MDTEKDERLWQIARKRASFQSNLVSFLVISFILWVIWWLTAGHNGDNTDLPWPVWPMLGMGIGLLYKFIKAYKTDNTTLTEREYEKLKNRQ